ncbi:hypothetical protein ACFE04_018278 [Oxalis oulophora]
MSTSKGFAGTMRSTTDTRRFDKLVAVAAQFMEKDFGRVDEDFSLLVEQENQFKKAVRNKNHVDKTRKPRSLFVGSDSKKRMSSSSDDDEFVKKSVTPSERKNNVVLNDPEIENTTYYVPKETRLLADQETHCERAVRDKESDNFVGKNRKISFLIGSSSMKQNEEFHKKSSKKKINYAVNNPDFEFELFKCEKRVKNESTSSDNLALPVAFKEEIKKMGGSDELLVIRKALTKTDLEYSQGRLSIPRGQIKAEFLTENEKLLLQKNGNQYGAIEADLIEPSLHISKISLKRWGSSKCYQLSSKWNSVVEKNNLEEGDMIQLWSYRVNSDVCFALVVEKKGEAEHAQEVKAEDSNVE